MTWTPERVDTLRKLWSEGRTGTQIAYKLGGVSRNAVIGKAHRLGLALRNNMPSARMAQSFNGKATARKKAAKRAQAQKAAPTASQIIRAIKADGLPIPTPAETDIANRSHNGLLEHHCRWPCWGDAVPLTHEPAFCGKKKIPGLPYCEAHARRAYAGPPPRRREFHIVAGNELQVA